MVDRISTSEDVKKLLDVCSTTPGTMFPWEALEELLAPLTRHDRRFRTICAAWRRHVRKWQNRQMAVVPGVGMRILYEHERAQDVCQTIGRTASFLTRAKADADDIQIAELTQSQVDEAHHVRHITHRLYHALSEGRARLVAGPSMPGPSPSMPHTSVA